jgi:hypothetical protein
MRERGAVDVREDGELEAERGEACERRGRVWEDRPLRERGRERGGCRRMLRLVARIGREAVRLCYVARAQDRDDRAIGCRSVELTTSDAASR